MARLVGPGLLFYRLQTPLWYTVDSLKFSSALPEFFTKDYLWLG